MTAISTAGDTQIAGHDRDSLAEHTGSANRPLPRKAALLPILGR